MGNDGEMTEYKIYEIVDSYTGRAVWAGRRYAGERKMVLIERGASAGRYVLRAKP